VLFMDAGVNDLARWGRTVGKFTRLANSDEHQAWMMALEEAGGFVPAATAEQVRFARHTIAAQVTALLAGGAGLGLAGGGGGRRGRERSCGCCGRRARRDWLRSSSGSCRGWKRRWGGGGRNCRTNWPPRSCRETWRRWGRRTCGRRNWA